MSLFEILYIICIVILPGRMATLTLEILAIIFTHTHSNGLSIFGIFCILQSFLQRIVTPPQWVPNLTFLMMQNAGQQWTLHAK